MKNKYYNKSTPTQNNLHKFRIKILNYNGVLKKIMIQLITYPKFSSKLQWYKNCVLKKIMI